MANELQHNITGQGPKNGKWEHLSIGLHALFNTTQYERNVDRLGSTGYLDFIKPKDFPTGVNMMKGVDPAGRKFITFLIDGNWSKETKPPRRDAVTIFQRYKGSENETFWVTAGFWDSVLYKEDDHIIDLDKVLALAMGEKVVHHYAAPISDRWMQLVTR